MLAARLHTYGPPENLIVEDVPPPPMLDGKSVRVAIHATSINPVDWKIRSGGQRGAIRYTLPRSLGMDLSGVVTEIGADVTRFELGDEVFASPDYRGLGTYAEETVLPESQLARKPTSLTHAEAASLPLVGLTAWKCIQQPLARRTGQRIFIMAGSGGVGTFAIQLAKHYGAHVATTCSPRNTELVQSLGADQVIDYRTTRFEDVLSDLDIVLDSLGHDATYRALPLLKRGGVLSSIVSGLPGNTKAYGPTLGVVITGLGIAKLRLAGIRAGVAARTVVRSPDGTQLAEIAGLVDRGALKPVIDKTFPLADIAAAHTYGETGRIRGKVVITVR